jgi:hypothetical protein
MTSTTSRRTILAIAASAAATTPALAFPVGPHPDAKLLALAEALKNAEAIAAAAYGRSEAAGKEYAARCVPTMPDACRPKQGDHLGIGLEGTELGDFYSAAQIDLLRDIGPTRRDWEIEGEDDGLKTIYQVSARMTSRGQKRSSRLLMNGSRPTPRCGPRLDAMPATRRSNAQRRLSPESRATS